MKQIIFALFIAITFVSCGESQDAVDVNIIEAKEYDVPAKFQLSYKVSIKDTSYTEQDIRNVINSFYDIAAKKKSKYHPDPTHIFVYVYGPDVTPNGTNWLGMKSMEMGKEGSIIIK